MKFYNQQKNKEIRPTRPHKEGVGGYAILFSVVIISIISMLSLGLSNTSYKQLVLSSLANNSQSAYFQSDTAMECALYSALVAGLTPSSGSWNCGVDSTDANQVFAKSSFGTNGTGYNLVLTTPGTLACFEIDVDKPAVGSSGVTTINTRGYNSCNKASLRTVERAIQVKYTELVFTAPACTNRWPDNDGDGYGAGQSVCVNTSVGYANNADDCYDANAAAYPGNVAWHYTADRGDGSWDFNCDDVVTRSDTVYCAAPSTWGWRSSVSPIPGCGPTQYAYGDPRIACAFFANVEQSCK